MTGIKSKAQGGVTSGSERSKKKKERKKESKKISKRRREAKRNKTEPQCQRERKKDQPPCLVNAGGPAEKWGTKEKKAVYYSTVVIAGQESPIGLAVWVLGSG